MTPSRLLVRLTIRLSPRTHALVKREAQMEGVSITQFVREAALARAYYAIGLRGEIPEGEDVSGLIAAIRRLQREEDGRRRERGEEQ